MKRDLEKEMLILELNPASEFLPSVSVVPGKVIIEGTEEQFKALWEMIGAQYDFQTEFDCEED
jgi:hypothetical protein